MRFFDDHLRIEITKSIYQGSDLSFQYLLTGITLDSFAYDVPALLDIITASLSDSSQSSIRSDILLDLQSYDNIHRHSKYHLLVIAFLTNQVRSGSLYRDKAQYISLTAKLLAYMCHL